MPALEELRGRRVGILGFAKSGEAVGRALRQAGAEPVVWDDRPEACERAWAFGLAIGSQADLRDVVLLVVSPGVPLDFPIPHPLVAEARATGIPICGDVQLFADSRPDLQLVGVTGSNGKSTTTALLHHLLVQAGLPAVAGGNIGTPVFDLDPPTGAIAVLELSSFQLDLCDRLRTAVGIWLNLSPDHLDRHGSLARYIAAKRRLFEQQDGRGVAVVATDDGPSAALARELAARGRSVVRVSGMHAQDVAVGMVEGRLVDRLGASERQYPLEGRIRLRGAHNRQNIAAAFAAARLLGATPESLLAGFATFTGLPHRMEEVGRIAGVMFVNDSKATNPDAAARSLSAFRSIYWIAGGRPKPGGFESLKPVVGGVRHGFFIGEAAMELARTFASDFPVSCCDSLAEAVDRAFCAARAGGEPEPVVLLAPACASFDQFRNFEHRGECFRTLVGQLLRPRAEGRAP